MNPGSNSGEQGYVTINGFALWHVTRVRDEADNMTPVVVVIEGDGRPWTNPWQIAADPTPARPLLLGWFNQWPGEAIYLGRPCYFQKRYRACDPAWYTRNRYGAIVTDALAKAIEQLAGRRAVMLVGHSGGGTLCMLIAGRIPQKVSAVVTLAGNLNTSAWTRHHGFSPLTGSLDPSRLEVLPASIRQVHIATVSDTVILREWIEQEAGRQQAEYYIWPVDGHAGWSEEWVRLNQLITSMGD
jgi:pimeloyl-ACP methyl ester carboxylesterase